MEAAVLETCPRVQGLVFRLRVSDCRIQGWGSKVQCLGLSGVHVATRTGGMKAYNRNLDMVRGSHVLPAKCSFFVGKRVVLLPKAKGVWV